jgi:oligopeptide transport system substrate-binding protein
MLQGTLPFIEPHNANMIRKICLAFGFALLAALLGCTRHDAASSAEVLRRGLGGEPSSLDPATAADAYSQQVLQDLYEGLTAESPTGAALPGVASSWSIDASGTQYTFQLRADARWSNGKPVRAADFVAAWRRVVDPQRGSPVADDLRVIAGAAAIIAGTSPATELGAYAPSDRVLVVKLVAPAPYLPQLLTHAAAYPIYSDLSARGHDPKTWVSNGPYVLAGWSPGIAVDLARNAAYWDRRHVSIPRVQYQVAPEENSQFARYRAGQLDMTDTVPANAVPALRSEHPTELVIAPFLATAYYGLNLSAPPFAANLKLRQALAMAIDRKRLVGSLGFGQAEAFGFVPPGTWNYSPQSWPWKGLDEAARVADAQRLYAEAGYSAASPLHLRVLFNANPVIRNTAIIIAAMWKQTLGIDTALAEEEYRVFLQSRRDKSRWDVARLAWTADYNDASNFLDIFRGDSVNNDGGYASAAFDALLSEAARSADSGHRRTTLESSEALMLADYPVVPLYFFVSKRLVKPYVRGVQSNPLNRVGSKSLELIAH